MNSDIILIQNWFNSTKRHNEYITCLRENANNPNIHKLILLCNDDHADIRDLGERVILRFVKKQPTYMDYFKLANEEFKNHICVIGNLDMYYPDIQKLKDYVSETSVVALSRYDKMEDESLRKVSAPFGTQDTWAFLSPLNIENVNADFTLGIGGCDHRIAFELNKNYSVLNPYDYITSVHVHKNDYRDWRGKNPLPQKDGYLYVPVCGSSSISFSLFSRKVKPHHRTWDDHDDLDRYWYNIPAIIATYKELYPATKINIFIPKSMESDQKYLFLKELHNASLVTIVKVDAHYETIEPTFWRYIPIFDNSSELALIRDLDSLPTSYEIAAIDHFRASSATVSTIRSHSHHNATETIMLAGLCAFKPNQLKHACTFNAFYSKYATQLWGSDQRGIINYTANELKLNTSSFLDYMLTGKNHKLDSSKLKIATSISTDKLNINTIKHKNNQSLFTVLDKITEWSGQPIDSRGDVLKKILRVSRVGNTIDGIISKCKMNSFYKI